MQYGATFKSTEHKNLFFPRDSGHGYGKWDWDGGQSPGVSVRCRSTRGVLHILWCARSDSEVKIWIKAVDCPVKVVKRWKMTKIYAWE